MIKLYFTPLSDLQFICYISIDDIKVKAIILDKLIFCDRINVFFQKHLPTIHG